MKKPTPSMTITTSSMADHPQVRFKLQASNRQLSLANNLEERETMPLATRSPVLERAQRRRNRVGSN
jgi:hypothetical protein